MRYDRRWFNAIVYIVDTLARRLLISYLGTCDGREGGEVLQRELRRVGIAEMQREKGGLRAMAERDMEDRGFW